MAPVTSVSLATAAGKLRSVSLDRKAQMGIHFDTSAVQTCRPCIVEPRIANVGRASTNY